MRFNAAATVLPIFAVLVLACPRQAQQAQAPARLALDASVQWSAAQAGEVASSLPMFHGRVVTEAGEPVRLFHLDGELLNGPDGSFHRKSGRGGKHTFVVFANGFASTTFTAHISPEMDTDVGRIVLTKGRIVQGRVVDAATRRPVSSALVDVSNTPIADKHETQLLEEYGAVRTDADGRFVLHAEETAPSLVIDDEHYIQKWMKLDRGPVTLSVELDAGGTLEGTVSPKYATDTEVKLVRGDGSVSRDTCVTERHYTLNRIPKGTYYLTVWSTTGQHLHPIYGPRTLRHAGHGKVVFNF